MFALIVRSFFIFLGMAIIDNFTWAFYVFGIILLITVGKLLAPKKEGEDEANNVMIRLAKRFLRTTDHYDGDKLVTYENGRKVLTPMLLVMVAIRGIPALVSRLVLEPASLRALRIDERGVVLAGVANGWPDAARRWAP
mgnify:CR=1 FL=1